MYIIIGMSIYKYIKDFQLLLKTIVLSSFLVAIYNILSFLVVSALSINENDNSYLTNGTAILSFIILFYARKFKYKIFENYIELLIMFSSFFAIVLSLSRTTYVFFLITLIIPYIVKKKTIL